MEEKAENKNSSLTSPELCFQCGLPSRKAYNSLVAGEYRNFCCNGCRTACEIIFSLGAESYYKNRLGYSEVPVKNEPRVYPYTSEHFQKQYIYENNGLSSVVLHLENLHCPSCIWVIEKVIGNASAVKDVSVNYTSKRAKILWNDSLFSLEEIINTLIRIGYPPTPIEKADMEKTYSDRSKSLLLRMVVAAFGMAGTMFLAEPFYFSYVQDLDLNSAKILMFIAFLFCTPIYVYCISPFYRGMLTALRFGLFTMDSTIFTGATLIYLYSSWAAFTSHPPVYFDCLTMFLFLILLGRFIESSVQQKVFYKAEQAIKKYPKHATLLRNGKEETVHIDELKKDDIILVRPGEQLPADGIVVHGESHVNESVVTGESRALSKKEGDFVLGGSINIDGALYFRAEKVGSETTFKKIVDLVENINLNRTKFQGFTDKVAHYFVLATLLIAAAVYFYYAGKNPDKALLTAISVIIVTCPCALGLATPAAITLGSSIGLKRGILFKNTESFEKISSINHIILDKTGTITSGKMEFGNFNNLSVLSENSIIEIAAGIERFSEHPAAWAIVTEACKRKIQPGKAKNFRSFPGKGVKGEIGGMEYVIGNNTFLTDNNIKIPGKIEDIIEINESLVFIADKEIVLGYFMLRDKIRENTLNTIENLKKKNISFTMLTGDKKIVADKIGKLLDIQNVISEVLPSQKADYVKALKDEGYRVAMIGDGVNDAPAMVQSDLGIAMCTKSDLANINADIIILNPDFSSIFEATELARKTYDIIRQNLTLSLVYNLIVIPVVSMGYISPLLAAVLMPVSSLIVLFNTLRLSGRYK